MKVQKRVLLTRVKQFERELVNNNIKAHDIVAVLGTNSLRAIAYLLACWRLGATTWICSPLESKAKISLFAKELEVKHFIRAQESIDEPMSLCFEGFDSSSFDSRAKTIIASSGSTGRPKFIEHRLEQHFLSAVGVNQVMGFYSGDTWLLSLPIFHVGGLAVLIRAMHVGAKIVVPSSKSKAQPCIESRTDITHVSLVPTQLKRLIARDMALENMERMKRVILGGAAVPDALIKTTKSHSIPIVCSWGSTEMASMWTATNVSLVCNEGSGRLLPSRELCIDKDGEIHVRGAMLFDKYIGSKQRPKEAFFATGDLGKLDKQGYLHILGRKDNMLISGGENIHPQEIESVLKSHPCIEEAVVVGVRDEKWGERPVAFVRYCFGADPSKKIIEHFLREHLPKFKIPDHIFNWPYKNDAAMKPSRNDIRQKAETILSL